VIDVHCHILPGVDDGALDLRDSVAMARQADNDGIELICATPHIRHDHDVLIHELARRVAEVNAELERVGAKARVTTGGEVAETSLDRLDDGELCDVTLGGGGRWILLEPAPGPLSDSLDGAIDALRARGFGAVIAHPERHADEHLVERLAAAVDRGCLVQLTAALLADDGAGPVMAGLARRGLVHLLGSDAHSSHGGRPVHLSEGLRCLRALGGLYEGELELLADAVPRAVVAGEPIEPPFAERR
jgi:protein-tyrosine phosphatase